uniref:NADH dehydrogenase subunit 6 n=1 Tax=Eulimnogammarus verrucosus TaxID=36941 RepID=V5QFJ2_EULVE|nr:NADH dehydrogenase subunit 6 [Eulimnogammarus verrucosus]AHB14324.1 NADH dehydrogenase subunit 6 [Eulimnogammarus verrucosus]
MTLFTLSTGVSLLYAFSKTPLMLAMLIVLQTMLVTMLIYTTLTTSWLSFILFMIVVSAMMVIFVYVSSLASNDFITLSHSSLMSTLYFTPLLMLMAFFLLNSQNKPTMSQLTLSDMDLGPVACYKMYTYHTSPMTMFLIIYLLVALITVVKISETSKGTLRALNT